MTNHYRSIQTTIGLGLVGSLALSLISSANAQSDSIPVTGGRAVFNDVLIFVPDSGTANPLTEALTQNGTPAEPNTFFIRTSQGNIPINAKLEARIFPYLNTSPGGVPQVGDQGTILGTLTFRGFTSAGEPGLFSGIPTELNFQIKSDTFSPAIVQNFTKYQTLPTTLTEIGTIVTPTTFTIVSRTTPIVIVQHRPGTPPPQDVTLTTVTPVTTIPASAFTTTIPGKVYSGSFDANLTGGSVGIPTPPGFNPSGTRRGELNNNTNGFNNPTPTSTLFIDRSVTVSISTTESVGFSQSTPALPTTFVTGIFTFTDVPSGLWFDPPMVESFEYEMVPRNIPIGLASRIFPGVMGQGTASDALFTEISGFPKGVDADDRFTVAVEGKVIGEFSPGDTLKFSDYAEQLGDSLINGEGVTKFTVSAIEPGVDAADPTAFPLKIEFNTPTASFEMRATGEESAFLERPKSSNVALRNLPQVNPEERIQDDQSLTESSTESQPSSEVKVPSSEIDIPGSF